MISQHNFDNFVAFLEESKVKGNVDILKTKEVTYECPCFYFPKYGSFALTIKHNGKETGRLLFDEYHYGESDNSIDFYMKGVMVGWMFNLPRYKW